MLGMGIGLLGVRGRSGWTPASLPPGVLLFWSGRTLRQVAGAVDGSGTVDGLSDASTAAWLADLSTHGRPLVQATAEARPIVGYHPRGRGIALIGEGVRSLVGSANLSGGRHFFAAATFVGLDLPSYEPLPAVFKSSSQGIITSSGATDEAHSALVGLLDTGQFWVSGGLSGPVYVDGVETTSAGAWYRRRTVRFSRSSDLATGALLLLRDYASAMPAQSWLHEVVILSASATVDDLARVQDYLDWHKSAPVVACSLDSLTSGYALSTHGSLTHKLARNYWRGCVSVPNLGVPGQMVTTATSGDGTKLDAVKGLGKNILVVEGGSNDINGGALASTVWTRLQEYRSMAAAKGWQVVLCTVPESSYWGTVGKTAEVAALNDLMSAGWQAAGFAGFVDVGAPANLDGLHYDAAGVASVAALVGPAVDDLLAA